MELGSKPEMVGGSQAGAVLAQPRTMSPWAMSQDTGVIGLLFLGCWLQVGQGWAPTVLVLPAVRSESSSITSQTV